MSGSSPKTFGICVSAGFGLLILIGCDGERGAERPGQTSHPRKAARADFSGDVAAAPRAGGDEQREPRRAAEAQVSIDNFTFSPQTLEIRAGTNVVWQNGDDVPHTVRSTVGLFRSEALDTDDRFERVFLERGTYEYYCGVHPHMTGKVVVK